MPGGIIRAMFPTPVLGAPIHTHFCYLPAPHTPIPGISIPGWLGVGREQNDRVGGYFIKRQKGTVAWLGDVKISFKFVNSLHLLNIIHLSNPDSREKFFYIQQQICGAQMNIHVMQTGQGTKTKHSAKEINKVQTN